MSKYVMVYDHSILRKGFTGPLLKDQYSLIEQSLIEQSRVLKQNMPVNIHIFINLIRLSAKPSMMLHFGVKCSL